MGKLEFRLRVTYFANSSYVWRHERERMTWLWKSECDQFIIARVHLHWAFFSATVCGRESTCWGFFAVSICCQIIANKTWAEKHRKFTSGCFFVVAELHSRTGARRYSASITRPKKRDIRKYWENIRISQSKLPARAGKMRTFSVFGRTFFPKTRKYFMMLRWS